MFYPHYAQMFIERDEPELDVGSQKAIVRKRFAALAERIVIKDDLKKVKKKNIVYKKIRDLHETDVRERSIEDFLEIWNRWRRFYFDVKDMKAKTKTQITTIENIIEMPEQNKLNLNMLIATTHKAYEKRRFRPNFNAVLSYGLEYYEEFYEEIMADIDRRNYEDEALKWH